MTEKGENISEKPLAKGKAQKRTYEDKNLEIIQEIKSVPFHELNDCEKLEKQIAEEAHKLEDEYETENFFLKLQFEEFLSAFWSLFCKFKY